MLDWAGFCLEQEFNYFLLLFPSLFKPHLVLREAALPVILVEWTGVLPRNLGTYPPLPRRCGFLRWK